jgi:hypothetical protein
MVTIAGLAQQEKDWLPLPACLSVAVGLENFGGTGRIPLIDKGD